MDQEINEIRAELKKVTRLIEENTLILRKMQRQARLATVLAVVKWIIFIGLTIGAFYYIQPFLLQIATIYQKMTGSSIDFMNLLKSFGGK